MGDITLDTITSGFNLSKISNNFQTVQDSINGDVLHLNGGNNVLQQDIDANSNSIFNLRTATQAGQAVPFEQLVANSEVVQYTGTVIESQTAGTSQTVFNLSVISYTPGLNNLSIYVKESAELGAVRIVPDDYVETTTTRVTFDTALPVGSEVLFVVNGNPIGGAGGGTTDDSVLAQTIINNIALGIIFTRTSTFTVDSTMAYAYNRIVSASPVNIQVPEDSSVNVPTGTEIHIRLASDVTSEVVPLGSVVVNPPSAGSLELGGQGSTVTLKKVGTNEWDLIGQVYAV